MDSVSAILIPKPVTSLLAGGGAEQHSGLTQKIGRLLGERAVLGGLHPHLLPAPHRR